MDKSIINEVILIPSTVLEHASDNGVILHTPEVLFKYLIDLGHHDLATFGYESNILINEAKLPIKPFLDSHWMNGIPETVRQNYSYLLATSPTIQMPKVNNPDKHNRVFMDGTSLIIVADQSLFSKTESHVNLLRDIIRQLENANLKSVMHIYVALKTMYMIALTLLD